MLKHCNYSDVAVILIHEIYGINDHMKHVAQMIAAKGYDVYCPNLLNRDHFHYDDEADAYQYFKNEIGFGKAKKQVLNLVDSLKSRYKTIVFWGYSVGATVAWLCCEHYGIGDAAIGYYGSRIRDYLNLFPKLPVLLLFSEHEKSFNVNWLVEQLSCKSGIKVELFKGQHGFANPFSDNYHPDSERKAFELSLQLIETIQKTKKNVLT
ncbi:dienelactone hydrolase family protein [Anoxybacillus eryuanensis]|uniref:dienelactone hydrolase family protein n=1 Tax=Anoxybacillus eryuanensis TaxID=651866 RepID=UPI003EF9D768